MKKLILTAAVFLLSSQTFCASISLEDFLHTAAHCRIHHEQYNRFVASANSSISSSHSVWKKAPELEKREIVAGCVEIVSDSIASKPAIAKAAIVSIGLVTALSTCRNKDDMQAFQAFVWSKAMAKQCPERLFRERISSVASSYGQANPNLPQEVLNNVTNNFRQ